jgi:hypothetical protein
MEEALQNRMFPTCKKMPRFFVFARYLTTYLAASKCPEEGLD